MVTLFLVFSFFVIMLLGYAASVILYILAAWLLVKFIIYLVDKLFGPHE